MYDGTTAATLVGTAIVTVLGRDVVTVVGTGTGVFADANVGTGKAVTVSGYTLGGAAAGNYTMVEPTGVTANITPASLTVSGISASNKVYDGTTAATLVGTAIVTALGSDVVTVGGTGVGAFADANVGTGKAVTVSGYTLSGAAAGNYTLVEPTGLTANITAAPVVTTTTPPTVSGEIQPELVSAINTMTNGTNLVAAFSDAKNVVTAPIMSPELVAINTPFVLPSGGNGNAGVAGKEVATSPIPSATQANVNVAMDNVVQLGNQISIVNGGIRLPDDMRVSQREEFSFKKSGK